MQKKISETHYTALLLVRKPAFIEWLEQADKQSGSNEIHDFEGDYSVYLLKHEVRGLQIAAWVKENYKELFENELQQWHDPEFWPNDLSFELFGVFFEVQMHRQVHIVSGKSETNSLL